MMVSSGQARQLPRSQNQMFLGAAQHVTRNVCWMGGLWIADVGTRVVQAFPGSRLAESAQIRLNQLQGTVPAVSTSYPKEQP